MIQLSPPSFPEHLNSNISLIFPFLLHVIAHSASTCSAYTEATKGKDISERLREWGLILMTYNSTVLRCCTEALERQWIYPCISFFKTSYSIISVLSCRSWDTLGLCVFLKVTQNLPNWKFHPHFLSHISMPNNKVFFCILWGCTDVTLVWNWNEAWVVVVFCLFVFLFYHSAHYSGITGGTDWHQFIRFYPRKLQSRSTTSDMLKDTKSISTNTNCSPFDTSLLMNISAVVASIHIDIWQIKDIIILQRLKQLKVCLSEQYRGNWAFLSLLGSWFFSLLLYKNILKIPWSRNLVY